jgi:hypothetical protein
MQRYKATAFSLFPITLCIEKPKLRIVIVRYQPYPFSNFEAISLGDRQAHFAQELSLCPPPPSSVPPCTYITMAEQSQATKPAGGTQPSAGAGANITSNTIYLTFLTTTSDLPQILALVPRM